MRKALMAGNWKMHLRIAEACKLAEDIAAECQNYDDREVLLAPPATALHSVATALADKNIIVASQNVCWEASGAFTGEISPPMVKDAGGAAVLVGHSERRQIFFESDALINQRVRGALEHGLLVVLCIGETLEDREADKTFDVLKSQLDTGLAGVLPEQMVQVVVAYEPVWAIGTGKTATKEQAQEAHRFIRQHVAKIYQKVIAEALRILYGGSVKPTNVDDLMAQPDIDGVLVGGASLDAASFGRIINFQSKV